MSHDTGVTVSCAAPYYVASNMSKIRQVGEKSIKI